MTTFLPPLSGSAQDETTTLRPRFDANGLIAAIEAQQRRFDAGFPGGDELVLDFFNDAWCEAHHRIPWLRGGRTDLRDLVPLCGFHHQRIHDPAYDRRYRPDGTISFVQRR